MVKIPLTCSGLTLTHLFKAMIELYLEIVGKPTNESRNSLRSLARVQAFLRYFLIPGKDLHFHLGGLQNGDSSNTDVTYFVPNCTHHCVSSAGVMESLKSPGHGMEMFSFSNMEVHESHHIVHYPPQRGGAGHKLNSFILYFSST